MGRDKSRRNQPMNLTEVILNENNSERLFEYTAELERANKELVNMLRDCVQLLTQFKHSVSDPHLWQDMLDEFEEVIRQGESVVGDKTFH